MCLSIHRLLACLEVLNRTADKMAKLYVTYSSACFETQKARQVLRIIVSPPWFVPTNQRKTECWIIWSSIEVHLVDALAAEGDEGRCSLR